MVAICQKQKLEKTFGKIETYISRLGNYLLLLILIFIFCVCLCICLILYWYKFSGGECLRVIYVSKKMCIVGIKFHEFLCQRDFVMIIIRNTLANSMYNRRTTFISNYIFQQSIILFQQCK